MYGGETKNLTRRLASHDATITLALFRLLLGECFCGRDSCFSHDCFPRMLVEFGTCAIALGRGHNGLVLAHGINGISLDFRMYHHIRAWSLPSPAILVPRKHVMCKESAGTTLVARTNPEMARARTNSRL